MRTPKHPVAMKTDFRDFFLINFAVTPDALQALVPSPLQVDTHQEQAFLSIVVARMHKMRLAFLPECCGIDYNQVVYRVVVRHQAQRGVYFIRSDADNPLMCFFRNWLTYFHFHHSSINFQKDGQQIHFALNAPQAHQANIRATYNLESLSREMPASSLFSNLNQAQAFLVELYDAFSIDSEHSVNRVHIRRGEWDLYTIQDEIGQYDFMSAGTPFNSKNTTLDSIFYVREIPYYWYPLERIL